MRYYIITSIYFKHVLTIVFKGNSNTKEWKDGFCKPLILLNKEDIYSVEYVVLRRFKTFKYKYIGTPPMLQEWLYERLQDSQQFMFTIKDKNNKKECWLFLIK